MNSPMNPDYRPLSRKGSAPRGVNARSTKADQAQPFGLAREPEFFRLFDSRRLDRLVMPLSRVRE